MTADQIIEVLQAWKEGKELEWKYTNDSVWASWEFKNSPRDFYNCTFRVKPEQRKPWEGWLISDNSRVLLAYEKLDEAVHFAKKYNGKPMHVREVMDEEDERPTETEDNRKVLQPKLQIGH